MRSVFEAFREPDYRRFWAAQFFSNIGSWMQSVAQGWLVYRLTDSPFLLGFVGFAGAAPSILLMLPGGVLADQLDRRKVLAASQWAQALAALALALSIRAGTISVWQIVAAAVVVGTAMSFSAPAYQAMVVDLLDDRSRLPNAVAMNSLQFNLSRALGPFLAGLALSAWGAFWCFFFNAVSFLPLIFVLGRIRRRQEVAGPSAALWERFAEAVAFVRRDRLLLTFVAIVAATSLFGFPFVTLMPILARRLFVDDAAGVGWLMGAVGAGALAGSLALSIHTPKETTSRRAIGLALLLFALSLGVAGLVAVRPVVMTSLVAGGAAMVVSIALCNTSIQRRVPDPLRGRVLGMYTFAFFAFIPFGNLMAGLLAEKNGIGRALVELGLGMLLVAAGATIAFRRARDAASGE